MLVSVFKQIVNETGKPKVSGRIGNGGTMKFLEKNGFPSSEMEKTLVHKGGDGPDEVVAIGRGNAEADVETARALEEFEGFDSNMIDGISVGNNSESM